MSHGCIRDQIILSEVVMLQIYIDNGIYDFIELCRRLAVDSNVCIEFVTNRWCRMVNCGGKLTDSLREMENTISGYQNMHVNARIRALKLTRAWFRALEWGKVFDYVRDLRASAINRLVSHALAGDEIRYIIGDLRVTNARGLAVIVERNFEVQVM